MRSTHRVMPVLVALAAVVATLLAVPGTAEAQARWVGGWTGAPLAPGPDSYGYSGFDNDTIRNIVRVRTSGDALRVRISNEFGTASLRIDSASVGEQSGLGADLVTGSRRALRFGGNAGVTIPVGGFVLSDTVTMPLDGGPDGVGTDLAISVYLPDPTGKPTYHQHSRTTSYIAQDSNRAQQDSANGFTATSSWWFVTGVEVQSAADLGTIVALGDSITDGIASDVDLNNRYTDYLAKRLQGTLPDGEEYTVVNQGISGNRLLADSNGGQRYHVSAANRLDRDVFGQPSVRAVIVLIGTNDLASDRTSGEIIRGLAALYQRCNDRGIRVIGATIPPNASATSSQRTRRDLINTWIRDEAAVHAVADFDRALRSPTDRFVMRSEYAADSVHPNATGNRAMADAIDLSWFR